MAVFNLKQTIAFGLLCILSTLHCSLCLAPRAQGFTISKLLSGTSVSTRMDKPFQGLQLMITNNMRKTLIEELQYEPEEVDDMEPQVAAGVVKRMLPRPVNGIPKEWRRPKIIPSVSSLAIQKVTFLLHQSANKLREGMKLAKNFNNKYVMTVMPGLVLVGLLLNDKNKVVEMAGSAVTGLRRLSTVYTSFARRILTSKFAFGGRKKDDEEEERLDFEAFNRVQHQSMWDRFVLRVNRAMGHNHER